MIESYRISGMPNYTELVFLNKEPWAEIHQGEDGMFYGYIFPEGPEEPFLVQGDTVAQVKEELLP